MLEIPVTLKYFHQIMYSKQLLQFRLESHLNVY